MEISYYGLRQGGDGYKVGRFLHGPAFLLVQTIAVISDVTCFILFYYCLMKRAEGMAGYYEWLFTQFLRSVSLDVRKRIVQ